MEERGEMEFEIKTALARPDGGNPFGATAAEYEHTGEMLYKTDRRHGLHHGGEQLAFLALA